MEKDIDSEVDAAMEHIRDTHYLTTEVSRKESIQFLRHLAGRCIELAGEITYEIMRYGEDDGSTGKEIGSESHRQHPQRGAGRKYLAGQQRGRLAGALPLQGGPGPERPEGAIEDTETKKAGGP